jgi:hypothetical protein
MRDAFDYLAGWALPAAYRLRPAYCLLAFSRLVDKHNLAGAGTASRSRSEGQLSVFSYQLSAKAIYHLRPLLTAEN